MKSLGHPPFPVLWHSMNFRGKTAAGWALDKNRYKPRICFLSLRLTLHSAKALRE